MNKTELIKRYLFFLAGLFVNSFGVAFITKADLGTSPISSIPNTLILGFRPTLGMFTLYMSLVLIAVQLLLLEHLHFLFFTGGEVALAFVLGKLLFVQHVFFPESLQFRISIAVLFHNLEITFFHGTDSIVLGWQGKSRQTGFL